MKLFTTIITLILFQFVYGQEFTGNYSDGNDHLNFNNDSVEFSITADGGFLLTFVGCGTYEIIKDYILINATTYCGINSFYKTTNTTSDSIHFIVMDTYNQPITAEIELIDSEKKIIGRYFTNKIGKLKIKENSTIDSIYVSNENSLGLKHENDKDYHFTLIGGQIWENKTIALKIDSYNGSELNLYFLTVDLNTQKNILRSLRKEDRKRKIYKRSRPSIIRKYKKI